ncbi:MULTISPECIES: hypothetical protein [Acetobacteraceae]|uniref:NADH:quinone oxidoreductase/Mrp antiporter membrane subunit domain-containing protein n=1 Tax=Parasaccharibacter apium TaxID=1510841 RepID=A0ABX4ZNH2_9PROT|nr:hypothetical protein [Parasaccharibacter apium]MUG79757.1 hypothetical protein [Bombella sp. ESL0380]MUH03048.1 hypothetical protein [Bombella sp. ESL0387]POS64046.1 hypothetical protein ASQ42_03240 [Parasaccharibacter apium]POS65501.1 hypothetical protein ASO19_00745 [Parasaccharibacter apium]POS65773.1 hypothetical protein ASQ43_00810 [Parasaccharibacter apium]
MMLAAASFSSGLFASPVLFGLMCWPFLVVWVLWASRRPDQASFMARLGLGLSGLALLGCSSGMTWGQEVCLAMEACVPALLFVLRGRTEPITGTASFREGMSVYLPFLVTGCVFMGLLLRPPLAALFFDGAGTVLLAWWDGRATRRAMPAWEVVRLRLSGLILAGLGFAVMQGGGVFSSSESAAQVGQVLALTGLCMMAGLGSAVSSRAELVLLDAGLRFVPLFLMALLAVTPFMRHLMVVAGLLALAGTFLGRQGSFPLLSWMTGLGVLAAGTGQMPCLLLLYGGALLATALRLGCDGLLLGGVAALPVQMVLPVIMIVLAVMAPLLGWPALLGLLACVMLGFRHLELETMPQGVLAVWQRGGWVMRELLLLLVLLALLAVALLVWGGMLVPPLPDLKGH